MKASSDVGKTLTYSIAGGPDAALFAIDAKTGALAFKAAPNFDTPTDSGHNNIYNLKVMVSDGTLYDVQGLRLQIADVAGLIPGTPGNDSLTGFGGRDTLAGYDGNDVLKGLGGSDILFGGAGNDAIYGGDGKDTLSGGPGRDTFYFDTGPLKGFAFDKIGDFTSGEDTLAFSKALFTAFTATGAIDAAAFWSGANVTAAHDASDRFIYNTKTGVLLYDADGNGNGKAPVEVALLANHPALAVSDFLIVA